MKQSVAKNTQFKEKLTGGLINVALSYVTDAQGKIYNDHIVKVEQTLWDADSVQDNLEPLIMRLTSSSLSSNCFSRSFSSIGESEDPTEGTSMQDIHSLQ